MRLGRISVFLRFRMRLVASRAHSLFSDFTSLTAPLPLSTSFNRSVGLALTLRPIQSFFADLFFALLSLTRQTG